MAQGPEERRRQKGAKDPIKGARWALLKNEGDLTAGQKAQLECIANTNVTLWEAYKLKERLRMILKQTADEAAPMLITFAGSYEDAASTAQEIKDENVDGRKPVVGLNRDAGCGSGVDIGVDRPLIATHAASGNVTCNHNYTVRPKR